MKTLTFLTVLLLSFHAKAAQTLLHSMSTTPKENMTCNVSVLVDFDSAEMTVVRLEAPGQKYDINNFQKRPKFYDNYSRRYALSQLFPRIDTHQIKTLDTKFTFTNGQTMEVVATLFEGRKFKAKRDIADFLRPAEKSCLLKVSTTTKK